MTGARCDMHSRLIARVLFLLRGYRRRCVTRIRQWTRFQLVPAKCRDAGRGDLQTTRPPH